MQISIFQLEESRDLPLPAYATTGAAGMDIPAALTEPITLNPGKRALVPTGLHVAIPEGYEGQIRPRSGLAVRHGIGIVNAPGTIDSDYRGEIRVILINLGDSPFTLKRGDRIAQLVVCPVTRVVWERALGAEIEGTARGAGGFGHTGINGLEEKK